MTLLGRLTVRQSVPGATVFISRYGSIAVIAFLLLHCVCVPQPALAQGNCNPPAFSGDEPSWRAAYIGWCQNNGGTVGNYYGSSGDYTGWGCHPIPGQWKCGGDSSSVSSSSSSSSAASAGTAIGNAMANVVLSYQKALDAARAREIANRNAATAANNGIAASASQNAEATEDAAQSDDLARYQAAKAGEAVANQDAFARAHESAGAFLNQTAALSAGDSSSASPAQQKAWKQLHCLAYVSRIAFEDLALNNLSDFHDLAPEASNAFNGAPMGVNCPAAPFPDLSGKNNVDMSKISGKLKSDMSQAEQIAQHMEQYHPEPTALPPIPANVAADPQLASAWKVQQAINAVNDAPNPGKTPAEFSQVLNDRDKIRQSLADANNAANGKFDSIQVDLSGAPATGATPQ
jgi:hypothetical protein